MSKKMFSAFLSSVYESLLDEREAVISTMLNYRVFPICMEHFTVADNKKFDDIKTYIDESDFFILLLGVDYGSTDADGVSWTEKEYEYANTIVGQYILAIQMPDLVAIKQLPEENRGKALRKQLIKKGYCNEKVDYIVGTLDKQIAFSNRTMAIKSTGIESIKAAMTNFFANKCLDNDTNNGCIGWKRCTTVVEEKRWREKNESLNLNTSDTSKFPEGKLYHIHLCKNSPSYLRVGTMRIEQDFCSENYQTLKVTGENFGANYDPKTKQISENIMKYTTWKGDYILNANGTVTAGVYNAQKVDKESYGDAVVNAGIRRGLHDFMLAVGAESYFMSGRFHDETSDNVEERGKAGNIFVFKSLAERDSFLFEKCSKLLDEIAKKA